MQQSLLPIAIMHKLGSVKLLLQAKPLQRNVPVFETVARGLWKLAAFRRQGLSFMVERPRRLRDMQKLRH